MYPVGFNRTPPKRTLSQNAGSDHYYFSLNSSNQEFTLDLTQNNPGGAIPVATYPVPGRSPGKSSPTRSANSGGRCVRELEEQLEELRKENFNLKLKIYFLEERFGRLYGVGEKADLAKSNIELQVEVESLKKELSDKVELLKQATVAIENLEQKQLSLRNEREDLGKTLKSLEEELRKHRTHVCPKIGNTAHFPSSSPMENSVALYLEAFGNRALDSEHELEKSRIESLEREIEDLRKAYSEQTEQLKSSRAQLEATEHSLFAKTKSLQSLEEDLVAKEDEINRLGQSLASTRKQLEDLNLQFSTQTQKYEGLSVEFGNKQERLNELESEVALNDQRIKQLLSELGDWKEILKKKEAQVSMLQEELRKKEPEIEYKVQEIEQKDKIIEEKEGQIEQQNKILVEIQITLDEKQKQIEELENALKEKAKAIEELEGNLKKAGRTLQGFVNEIQSKEKELETLSTDTKKKEKKIRDLTSELKEVKDMLNKAKWEAQTGRDDNVNSMAEEENENLAVQLGQKEEALAAADRQLKALNQRSEEIQRELDSKSQQLSELQKENNSLKNRRSSRSSSNCRKLASVENTRHLGQDDLRKQLTDAIQQLNIVQAEKIDLMNEQAELRAKLNESTRRSSSSEVKDLQRQVKVKDAELERLQKDIAKLKEETRKLREKESELENIRKELQKSKALLSPKDQTPVKRRLEEREKEVEKLKAELQKVRSEKEDSQKSKCDTEMKYEAVQRELESLKVELVDLERLKQILKEREAELNEMVKRVKQLDKELNEYHEFKSQIESEGAKKDKELESFRIRIKQLESESFELASLRAEIKQKVEEHKLLQESLERTKQLLTKTESNLESATSEGLVSKEVFDRVIREKNERLSMLENTERTLRHQIDSLKIECDMYRAKNSNDMVQSLLDETKRQQELVKKYKEEVVKLRKRLADSTNACDMLRTRLEEMADFLEEILNMDERGLVDLSSWSFKHKQKLHNSIAKSRELSRTLSQSLMIGIEDQDCELSVLDGFISSTSVSSWSMSRPDESRQMRVGQSEFVSMENSEIVNWNQSFMSRTAGQIIDSEVPGSRLCIVDRSLHNSQPIQSADYDVLANTEEHRKVAAKLSEELEARMAELVTARRTVTEYERKVKDQNLIIENLKQTILKLEELSTKRESSKARTSDLESSHCDVSTQTIQFELKAIPVIITEDLSERRGSQELSGALQASTSVAKSTLFTASLHSSQVVVAKAETRSQQVSARESVHWERDQVPATPRDSPRAKDMKFLSSTPFHQPVEMFEGLERPNFSLSGASLRLSPVPTKPKKVVESDSEEWSEPDRDVSQQRIGLELADSDYVHQKDTFTDSDGQIQSPPKPSPRKIKENIRELRVLRHHIRQLKSSAKILRDELQVYEYLCNQLHQVLPTLQPPEGKQGGLLDHLYEMTGMVLDLTEKRRLVDDLVEKQESLKKVSDKSGRAVTNCEDDSLQAESDPRKSSSDQYKRVVADHKNAIGELKLLCDRLQKKMTNLSVEDSRAPSSTKVGTVGKLEVKLRKANSTIKDLQEKGILMKESLMRKESRLAEKDSEITRLGFVIKEKEFSVKEYSVKVGELDREKSQLQKIVENLKTTSKCGEQCATILNEAKRENEQLFSELEALKSQLDSANFVVKSLEEEVASVNRYRTVNEEITEKFKTLEKSFESLTAEKNSLQVQFNERINEISIKNSTIENLMTELAQKSQELEHIRNQLENAEACINNFESARQNYIEHISSSESVPKSPRLGSSSNLARPSGFLLGKREEPTSMMFTESPSGSGRFFNQSTQRVLSSKVSQCATSSTLTGDGTSIKEHVRRQYSEFSELSETTIDEMHDVTSLSFKGFVPPTPHLLAPDALLSPTEVKSPDLGIESDPTSRFSSLGNNPDKQQDDRGLDPTISSTLSCKNCAILYTKYQKAKKALAATAEKLRISNERKEKIDKALNKELVKTHGVLKQAKGYLELCHTNVSKNN